MKRHNDRPASVSLTPNTSLKVALWLLSECRASTLPVIDQGQYLGVVLKEDLLKYAPSPANTLSQWEYPDLLENILISEENLVRQIPEVGTQTTTENVLDAMRSGQSNVVAMVKDGRLFQLINWQDVLDQMEPQAAAC